MIAKLAYLTSPGPGRFVLNIQKFGSDITEQIEISRAHLANVIIDGASMSLREYPTAFNSTDNRANAEHERDDRHQRPA